jgi:hypothetical protein
MIDGSNHPTVRSSTHRVEYFDVVKCDFFRNSVGFRTDSTSHMSAMATAIRSASFSKNKGYG